jgi:type II secretory pathway component PulF
LFDTFLRARRHFQPAKASRAEQVALLRLLSLAVERQLALPPMLEAFAEDTSAARRHRVLQLAELLKSGTNLPEALEQVPDILPDDVVLAVRFGAESGTLAESLRSSASALARRQDEVAGWLRGFVLYVCVVLSVLGLILTFIMVKIVPTFEQIFMDFAISLPESTKLLIELSRIAVKYWYLILLAVIVLDWAFMSRAVDRSARRGLLARFCRPMIGFHVADVLRSLAVVVSAGRPLLGAVSTLARYHYDPVVRRQLLYVRNEVELGADVWQSMHDAGLIRECDAEVIEAGQMAGNQAWALNQVAQRMMSRSERRIGILLEFVRPILLVAVGAAVGFVVVSLFSPLVSLIQDLT